jgi:hypothetical protein
VDVEQLYAICSKRIPVLIETLQQMIRDMQHGTA